MCNENHPWNNTYGDWHRHLHLLVWQSKSLVAPSHFHEYHMQLLGQLFYFFYFPLMKSHLVLDHSWKKSLCGEDHNYRTGLLRGEAVLARLEWWSLCHRLLNRWIWPFFFFFFLPAKLSCQPSRCLTFSGHSKKNERIWTHCPRTSNAPTAKASPVQEVFHCGA